MSHTAEYKDFAWTKIKTPEVFRKREGEKKALPDLNHLRSDPLFMWLVVHEKFTQWNQISKQITQSKHIFSDST